MNKIEKVTKCSKTVSGEHIWNPETKYLNIETDFSELTELKIEKCVACGMVREISRS
jgi:hypothetical protein